MILRSVSASGRLLLAIGAAAICTIAGQPAHAHFTLQAPESWKTQDAQGMPQKMGPCGDEAGGTETGTVTPFQPGDMVTITIDEKIFHPGHYRIALSVLDRSELPPEPPVTAGNTECGSVPIMDPPTFPVLADGVFLHTSPFNAPQSVQIQLPNDVTCDHCTLQVLEWMSNHGAPCFYHHCADISIGSTSGPTSSSVAASGAGVGGGAAAASGAGPSGSGGPGATSAAAGGGETPTSSDTPASDESGCSCSVPSGKNPTAAAGLAGVFLALSLLRRRRSRDRV